MNWWKRLWVRPSVAQSPRNSLRSDLVRAQTTTSRILAQTADWTKDDLMNLALQFLREVAMATEPRADPPDNPALQFGVQLGIDCSAIGWDRAEASAIRILSQPGWSEPEPAVMNLALQFLRVHSTTK
jgi:hypothetical protein